MVPIVILAGAIAGFINTLAGSGSAVTLPVLELILGGNLALANGTNRIGILLQNFVAVRGFHRQQLMPWRRAWQLAIPAALGAILGAVLAVHLATNATTKAWFRFVVGILMLGILALIITKPERFVKEADEENVDSVSYGLKHYAIFFGIGVYGGFIQMGVGVFLLMGLVWGARFDLIRANAIKVLIVLTFTVTALAVFLTMGQVHLLTGFVLSIGTMLGAWLATTLAIKKGAPFVRWILIVVISIAALNFLDVIDIGEALRWMFGSVAQ